MHRFALSILMFGLLFFSAGAVAQDAVPNPGNQKFLKIQASLDDGFYALAEQQVRGMLSEKLNEADEHDGVLLLCHALWGQKRYSELLLLLQDYGEGPGVAYWQARAYYELHNYEEALDVLAKSGAKIEGSPYAAAALRLKGRMELLLGWFDAAEKSFKQFSKEFPEHANAVDNMLDLADVFMAQQRYSEAKALYEKLLDGEDKGEAAFAQLKLARVLYEADGDKDEAAARALLLSLATNETTRLSYRIDAYVELAALEDKGGRFSESIAALRKGVGLAPDARLRVSLKLAMVRKFLQEDEIDGALKLLEECRTEAPDQSVAAELQLEKAGALLRAKRYKDAGEAYQVYLDVADDPDGLARAYMGKGLALWGLERFSESAVFFDKAEKRLPENEKATTLAKAGDAYYQAGQLENAEKRYRTFIVDYPGHVDMPNVLYQLGLVLAKIGRRSEALTTFNIIETSHPSSPFAEEAAMRSADIMRASGQPEEALEKYTQISNAYTNSATAKLAHHQRGLVLYQLGRYEEALKVFDFEVENYPESENVPQAFYMRGFCLFAEGDKEGAIQTCRQFIDRYPDSLWVPDVVFWLAELYFNQGDYAEAEPLFLRVAHDFQESQLAPRALYWAARAAAAESDYVNAVERYSEVARNYPDCDILPQVRFNQGDALTEMGDFARATLAFEEIIKKFPESELVNAAWGRKGDCQFSLAAENPARYEEAMNSYQAILDRPTAPATLKMQAEYKIGRCLEVTGMPDKAFSRYMNVVYTFRNVERNPYSIRWFTRAAFGAAALKENEQAWVEAVNVYKRVLEADVPARGDALKRIEKIKTANWLLFQQAEEKDHVGTDG